MDEWETANLNLLLYPENKSAMGDWAFEYETLNRLTVAAPAGNVLADGQNQYAYDGEGRLCAVYNTLTKSYTGYLYNAAGTRTAAGTITSLSCNLATNGFAASREYLLGLGGDQVTELSGTGAWKHSNVWAGAHLAATYDTKGLHFHLSDPLGTRRVQTNVLGQVENSFQSLPFGDGYVAVPTALATADDATENHFTGKERDTESGNDYFGARYYASSMGRFLSPDPLYIEMHRLGDPQQWNLYMYGRNNPLKVTDPTGLDITCQGARCADYLAALQRDVSFNIQYDKNGMVQTEGNIDMKSLSKSDKAFLSAIDDSKHHVTINAIDGTSGHPGLFFGSSDGNHTGTHTIAFGQAALLDAPGNAGGFTSAGLVGHETLEGYSESKGNSFADSHNYATGLGFPGLDAGRVIGFFGNPTTKMVFGFAQQWQVHGTNTIENIRFQFASPIPAASIHSGMGAIAYPSSVEKAK